MNSKEALERLVSHQEYDVEYYEQMCKDSDLVKSALERNEKLEKVWEIAKTHIALDYWLIKSCDTVFTYNNLTITNKLTETEFNLIKEMLEE